MFIFISGWHARVMKVKPNEPSKCRLSVYLYSPDKKCIRRRSHLKKYCADQNIDLQIFNSVRFFYNPSLMISAKKLNDLKKIKDWSHNETSTEINEKSNHGNKKIAIEKVTFEESIIEKSSFEEFSVEESTFEESFNEESNFGESSPIEETAFEKYSEKSNIGEYIDSIIREFTIEDSTFEKFAISESSIAQTTTIEKDNFGNSNIEESIIEQSPIIRESNFEESAIDDAILENSNDDNGDGNSDVVYFGYWKPFPKQYKEFLKLEKEREEKHKLQKERQPIHL